MLTTQFRKDQRHLFQSRTPNKNLAPKNLEEVQIIEKWRVSRQDIGSVDIEIGLLSEKIASLEEHLQKAPRNEKYQLRLQLIASLHSRKKKLDYLLSTDSSRYFKALDRLKKTYDKN